MNILKKKYKSSLLHISSYLFLLIPVFLITGPFLSDLALSLISIFFLVEVFRNKKFEYFNNKFFYFFITFYIYLILNSVLQNQNIDSLKISLGYLRFGIFCLAVIYIIDYNEEILKKLFNVLFFTFSILIFDGFYQFFNGENIFGFPLNPGPRVSSFFNDELILGSYLSRLFPIFFGLLVYLNLKLKKIDYFLSCIIFIFAEVLIYLSGERAAFFYMNLSSVFILFAISNFKKLRLIILFCSLMIILAISLLFPNTKARVFNHTANQMKLFHGMDQILLFSIQHHDLYKTAINISKDNIIFGVGVKNFRNFCSSEDYKISQYSCNTHPHNTYIQLLSELGLIGLFFGIIIISFFTKFIINHFKYLYKKKYYLDDFQVCLMSAILITIWPLIPTGNLFNNWLNIIYYFPVGILLWTFQKKTKFAKKTNKE